MKIKFLTVREVAEMARVTEFSVYRWISSGQLRGTKIGGVTRIAEDDLRDFVVSIGGNRPQTKEHNVERGGSHGESKEP